MALAATVPSRLAAATLDGIWREDREF